MRQGVHLDTRATHHPMASQDASDDDDVPLHHRKAFGSGIRRQKVTFVRASSPGLDTTSQAVATSNNSSVGDLYLSLVLPSEPSTEPGSEGNTPKDRDLVCEVCKMPLRKTPGNEAPAEPPTRKHEASLVHQVCLTHSHPPSAIDRTRRGLAVLESYGWDPDSRQGLGSTGQGIQHPIKAVPKEDTLGLGLVVPKEFRDKVKKKKPQKLDAKQCRKMADEDKRKSDRLRRHFYGNDALDKYLGSG